ncbi:MAG: putative transglutaminase-like cysteine proteinase [Lentisphaeria bacterium]|jgi:predicted transglutaminase-like cysteine proteinase
MRLSHLPYTATTCSTARGLLARTFAVVGLFAAVVLAAPEADRLGQQAELRYGEQGRNMLLKWRQLLDDTASMAEVERLAVVNVFFNRNIVFSTDKAIWNKTDYWATPLETMGRKQGDCEDFSIAKYVTLLKLGIAAEKLRLVYVKADRGMGALQAHMVLAYYPTPNGEPLIMDNLSPDILPASQRKDLFPVFSFNSAGLWVGNDNQPKIKKPETRLSRWRDVLIRMQAEGLQ